MANSFYDDIYETLYKAGYHATKNLQVIEKIPETLCKKFKFNSIIDVGCSNGFAVKRYMELNKIAYGIDVASTAISIAHKNNLITCFKGSILNIPFKSSLFDAVVTCDVLEHLKPNDICQAVKELIRVTKYYLFIKVCPKIETNIYWINFLKLNHLDKIKDMTNLHLSVFSIDEWISFFLREKDIQYLETIDGVLIFKKG